MGEGRPVKMPSKPTLERARSFAANLLHTLCTAPRPDEEHAREVALPALQSGIRLFDDAEILQKHGRLQSATALTVLALEEVGKASIVKWKELGLIEREIARDLANHEKKQQVGSYYRFGVALMKSAQHREINYTAAHNDLLGTLSSQSTLSDVRAVILSILPTTDSSSKIESLRALLQVFEHGNASEILLSSVLARFRIFDKLKFSGFYHDSEGSDAYESGTELYNLEIIKSEYSNVVKSFDLPFIAQVSAALCYEMSDALQTRRPNTDELPDLVESLVQAFEKFKSK